MADDRIDIEINDKIDDNIPKKLRDIASGADKGEASVKKLKAALAEINSSPAARLKEATDNVTSSLNRELEAQNRLSASVAKAAAAQTKLASEKAKAATASAKASIAYLQEEAALSKAIAAEAAAINAQARLGTETAKTANEQARAATEAQRLATEQAKTAQATTRAATAATQGEMAALRLAQAQERAANGASNLYTRAERLRSSIDPLYAAQMRFNSELNEANALLTAGAINMNVYQQAVGAADARLKSAHTAQNAFNMGLSGVTRAGKGASFQTANVAAQMNDLGVQFAMAAQSGVPLQMVMMALIQQGSQLSYIANTMEGGWKQLIGTMGGMLLRFWPLIVAALALTAALAALKKEANDEGGLKDFANTLGLTSKEMKKLEDVTVTYGDTAKAVFQVIGSAIWGEIGGAVTKAWSYISEWLTATWELAKKVTNLQIGAFVGAYNAIVATWRKWPAAIGDVFYQGVNMAVTAINFLIRKSVDGVNFFIQQSNRVLDKFGLALPEISAPQVAQVKNQYAGAAKEVGGAAASALESALKRDYVGKFSDAVTNQAIQNAKDRLRKQAREMIDERTPKVGKQDKTAENRAQALKLVNMELDNELQRMQQLKPEREIAQRMDQIEQQLASKKITLNETERKSIEDKVRAIRDYADVQQQLDRIYEEATGPMTTYNATLKAAKQLLDEGAISQQRYGQEVVKANNALAQAVDPLHGLKENMDAAEVAATKYGIAVEKANYYEQIRQQMLSNGTILSQQYVAGVNAEVDALMRRNDALLQQQYIQSQVAQVVDPILDDQRLIESKTAVYAEIDRLRQQDVLSEEMAQRAKLAFEMKVQEKRLSAASSFFGSLASITKGGHGAIGAISKAAAVAQATIDGYVAVQKALASAPPPWNYIAAAAVAIKTGAQVAGIISTNVGSYQNGGQFMVDGRAGVDKNNINMNVSRGERVTIETPAQQRANDGGSGSTVNANTKVVNYFDEKSFIAAMDSDEGDTVVMNIIKRNATQIGGMVGAGGGL